MSKRFASSLIQEEAGEILVLTEGNKKSINKYGYSIVIDYSNDIGSYKSNVIYDSKIDGSFSIFIQKEEFWRRIFDIDSITYKNYLESIGIIEYSKELMYLVADLLMFLNNKNILEDTKKGLVILVCTCINSKDMAIFIKGLFNKYHKTEDFYSYLDSLINYLQQRIKAFEEIDFGNILARPKQYAAGEKHMPLKKKDVIDC